MDRQKIELPRFYYKEEYSSFYYDLKGLPHTEKRFEKGEYLWKADTFISRCFYIEEGIMKTFYLHEDGHQRILDFHGKGDITPGCHATKFKIEKSICTQAITKGRALCFSREVLHAYGEEHPAFGSKVLEVYAKYINNLIYQNCHQEYNSVFLKLCNLLVLFGYNTNEPTRIPLSQEEIGDILAVNRVNVTRALGRLKNEKIIEGHRGWIEVKDPARLCLYCSTESVPDE